MLVVISDLHFVDGTAGEHNLPYGAFSSVFLSNIVSLARDKGATELKLLLLGDVPDLVRSQQWLLEEEADRPWGRNGLLDIPHPRPNSRTEQCCLKILGRLPADGKQSSVAENTILYKNWRTFEFFRYFKQVIWQRLGRKIPVEVIYVVGNHDRMCNLYPSVRDELRKMLGLTITEDTVEVDHENQQWWYRYDFIDEAYGVYARHGHQYETANYDGGADFTRLDHLQVPIGDLIATEFAVNLPHTLATISDKYEGVTHQLVENLKEIDNVRPLSRIMQWFYYQIEKEESAEVRKALDETFDTVLTGFLNLEFVKQWRNPNTVWDEFLRIAGSSFFRWIPSGILRVSDTSSLLPRLLPLVARLMGESNKEVDDYAAGAYHEPLWRENRAIQYILYGHTHAPMIVPLHKQEGRQVSYVNTGTWRGQIKPTISLDEPGGFVDFKQITYSIFYNKDEDSSNKLPGTVSFEMWTGHKKKMYS